MTVNLDDYPTELIDYIRTELRMRFYARLLGTYSALNVREREQVEALAWMLYR